MKRNVLSLVAALMLVATASYAEETHGFSINNGDAAAVKIVLTKQAKPMLEVNLTEEKAGEFAEFTQNNLNQKVSIQIDGETMIEPLVRSQITGGMMTFELDDEEAAFRLAKTIMKE